MSRIKINIYMDDLTNLNSEKDAFICKYSAKKSVCFLVFIEHSTSKPVITKESKLDYCTP